MNAPIDDPCAALRKSVYTLLIVLGTGLVLGRILAVDSVESEKLRVSLSLAMSLNPELRIIRIEDASILDAEGIAVVEEMAKDHDYTVLMEMVMDESDEYKGTGSVLRIEDGTIASESK